jgi:signal transduction histidine kinase
MNNQQKELEARCELLEKQLIELKGRYQTLFEHSVVPNCECDLSGAKKRLDYLRSQGTTDLGKYLEDNPDDILLSDYGKLWKIIRMNRATFQLPDARDPDQIFTTYNDGIKSDPDVRENHIFYLKAFFEGRVNLNYEITRHNPPFRSTQIVISVPPGYENTLARVFVTNNDLTDLREAEKRLLDYQKGLEEKVQTRTIQLRQEIDLRKREEEKSKRLYQRERVLHQKLQKEMKDRTAFLRSVVHEIRTPLTSVLAAGELLTSRCRTGMQQTLAKHLYQGACDLDSRINELYDFTKSEMGTLRIVPAMVDLSELFNDTLESVRPQTVLKGQALISHIDGPMPEAFVDGTRIRQVILNILNNAVKFTPKGGTIEFSAFNQDDSFVVAIADNGPGIARAEQPKLFQPYYTGSGKYSGLGLGLPIAKNLVELHRGRIWVESDGKSGSTFSFSIPIKKSLKTGGKRCRH